MEYDLIFSKGVIIGITCLVYVVSGGLRAFLDPHVSIGVTKFLLIAMVGFLLFGRGLAEAAYYTAVQKNDIFAIWGVLVPVAIAGFTAHIDVRRMFRSDKSQSADN